MLTTFKPHAEKSLKPLASLLKNVDPNVISMTGLIFPVLFFLCVINGLYVLGLGVFIFNGVDMLDGMVARAQGKVTAFGGFIDSTIDRFADFTVIAAFGFSQIVGWPIVLPLIMFTYLISYIRTRTEYMAKGKVSASVGIIERTERLLIVFLGLLLYTIFPNARLYGQNLAVLTFIILLVLSAVTVIQRVTFAYHTLKS